MEFLFSNLKYLDAFRQKFNLHFQSRENFPTLLGGIMTIFIVVIAIVLSVDFGQELYKKKRPYTSFNNIILSSPPKINFNANNILFAISILDKNFQSFDYENFFDFEINLINKTVFSTQNYYNDNGGTSIKEDQHKIDIQSCLGILGNYTEIDNYISEDPIIKDQLKKNKILNGTCFYNDFIDNKGGKSSLYLEGDINSNIFSYLQIKIKKCTRVERIDCLSDSIYYTNKILNPQLALYLIDKSIDPYNFDQPVKYFLRSNYFSLDNIFTKNIDLYFKNSTLLTDKGIMFQEWENQTLFNFNYLSEKISSNKNNYLAILNIQSSLDLDYYRRYYMKLQDLAAIIGGVVNAGMVLGELISTFFNKHLMYSIILNNLFDFNIKNKDVSLIKNNVKFNNEIEDIELKTIKSSLSVETNSKIKRRNGLSLSLVSRMPTFSASDNNIQTRDFKENNYNEKEEEKLFSSKRNLLGQNNKLENNNDLVTNKEIFFHTIGNEKEFRKPNKNYSRNIIKQSFDTSIKKRVIKNKELIKSNLLNISSECKNSDPDFANQIKNRKLNTEGNIHNCHEYRNSILIDTFKKSKENFETSPNSEIDEEINIKNKNINETKFDFRKKKLQLTNLEMSFNKDSNFHNDARKNLEVIKEERKEMNSFMNISPDISIFNPPQKSAFSSKNELSSYNFFNNNSDFLNEKCEIVKDDANKFYSDKSIIINNNMMNSNFMNCIDSKIENQIISCNNSDNNLSKIFDNKLNNSRNLFIEKKNDDQMKIPRIKKLQTIDCNKTKNKLRSNNSFATASKETDINNNDNLNKNLIRSKTRKNTIDNKRRFKSKSSIISLNMPNKMISRTRRSKENVVKFYNNLISNKEGNLNMISRTRKEKLDHVNDYQIKDKNEFSNNGNFKRKDSILNRRKKSKVDQKLILLQGISFEEFKKSRMKSAGVLDIGIWQLLSMTFCPCSKRIKKNNEFLESCQGLMGKYLDYIKIIELLKEFNRLKKILFSNNQLRLFSYLPNPILNYKDDELEVDSLYKDIFFGAKVQTKKLSKLLNSYVKVLGKQSDCENEEKINNRIIDFMDTQLKKCFESIISNYLHQNQIKSNVNAKVSENEEENIFNDNCYVKRNIKKEES